MKKNRCLVFWVLTVLACLCVIVAVAEECPHENGSYEDYGYGHEYWCHDCHRVLRNDHESHCASPDVCIICGLEGVKVYANRVIHSAPEYVDLGKKHQLQCRDCGYADDAEMHWGVCTAPTICTDCGLENVTIAEHCLSHDFYMANLGDYHQELCHDCSYQGWASRHAVVCTDGSPAWCSDCGNEVYVSEQTEGFHADVVIGYTAEYHLWTCIACFASGEPEPHYIWCDLPTMCAYCNAPVEEIQVAEVFHSVEATPSNFTFTDTNHTFTCDECHESITEPHDLYFYYGKEDECYCGYVKSSETRLPGDVNADGTVNMRDALALLKKLADWDVTINQSNSDVNGDGAVNMRDALTLLKYLADWDVVLK